MSDGETNKYTNWVRDSLFLQYIKDGIEVFVDSRSASFHATLKVELGNDICTCSSEGLIALNERWVVKNCNGLCQDWLNSILSHHRVNPLSIPKCVAGIVNPKLWPSDYWEVMKLYQTRGFQDQHSALDADLVVLLDLMINCDHFFQFDNNHLLEVMRIRNRMMRSTEFLVDNPTLADDEHKMLTFLRSLASSLSDTESLPIQTAIDNIKMLQRKPLDLSLNRGLELSAIRSYQIALHADIRYLALTIKDTKMDTATTRSDLIQDQLYREDECSIMYHKKDTEVQCLQESEDPKVQCPLHHLHNELDNHQENMETNVECLQDNMLNKVQDIQDNPDTNDQGFLDLHDIADIELTGLHQRKEAAMYRIHELERVLTKEHSSGAIVFSLTHLQLQLTHLTNNLNQVKGKVANPTVQAVNIKDLQRQLVRLYESRREHLPIYLTRPGRKIRLEDIYVEQRLQVVDPDIRLRSDSAISSAFDDRQSEKFISSLRDVFYSEDNKCQYIYVSGNAGYGKSTFCSHLVRLWCKVHSQEIIELTPDEAMMAEFPLLFFIDLRDATYKGTKQMSDEICFLIQKQLQLHLLGVNYNDLCGLLQADFQVLVVMDAFDECEEKSLPRYGLYNKCTTLVTSRPWKLDAIRFNPEYRIGMELEIVGLRKGSTKVLSEKVVKLLNEACGKQKDSNYFIEKMEGEDIEQFLNIPLLLISMLRMWFDDVPIGHSQTEIYRNIIHLHLLSAKQANVAQIYSIPSKTHFPACHREICPSKCYGKLLWKVSEFACKTLLSKLHGRSLVIVHDQAESIGLTDADVDNCLQLGILTQYKQFSKAFDYEPHRSVSFTHKTYLEWFSAVYLSSSLRRKEPKNLLSEVIVDLDNALSLDQVLVFVCGMNSEVASTLSELIQSTVSLDARVQEYRSSSDTHGYLIQTIQNIVVAGAVEAQKNGMDIALQLNDIYLTLSIMRYSTKQILACNISYARSVHIMDVTEIHTIAWPMSPCLQKVHLYGISHAFADIFFGNFSSSNLECLCLFDIALSHNRLENLCMSLATSRRLKIVDVRELTCLTCKGNKHDCTIMLDLSQHRGLERLLLYNLHNTVWRLSLSQKMNKLRSLDLGGFRISATALMQTLETLPEHDVKIELGSPLIDTVETRKLLGIGKAKHRYDSAPTLVLQKQHSKLFIMSGKAIRVEACEPEVPTDDTHELERRWKYIVLHLMKSINAKRLEHDVVAELQILPKQSDVQTAFQLLREHKFQSKTFDTVCQAICQLIQSQSEKIRSVKTCRTTRSPEHVVFLAIADCDVQLSTDYNVKICHPNSYSEEGIDITYSDIRQNKLMTAEESKDISTTKQEHSKRLFDEHSNVQMISGCSVKSRGFGTPDANIEQTTCIVIYVDVKGLIPIHETTFPRLLEIPGTDRSLPVDVREGRMSLLSHPYEQLERKWESLMDSINAKRSEHDVVAEFQTLPKQSEIQTAFQLLREHKFQSKTFDTVCQAICQLIQSQSEKIRSVKTCRTTRSPEHVVFLAIADCDLLLSTDYNVKICHPNSYSEEGIDIIYSDIRQNKLMTAEESKDISTTKQEHSKRLFDEHSNVRMISGCSVKSRGFGTSDAIIEQTPCIVIYVNVKGLIPIHETFLPRLLKIPGTNRSLPVDVREGGMTLLSHPYEHHSHLKMGCEITDTERIGTLGPIIESNAKTYCLTAAHMFFGNKNQNFIDHLKTNAIYRRSTSTHIADVPVYQGRICLDECKPFGIVEEVAYLSNAKEPCIGLDLAAIDITDFARQPHKGSFPTGNTEDAGYGKKDYPVCFTSGKVYDEKTFNAHIDHHANNLNTHVKVMKYGCKTEFTDGKIDIEGTATRRIDYLDEDRSTPNRIMYNQLNVLSTRDPRLSRRPFAGEGDSGALVLAKHNGDGDDLRAVGMVVGRTSLLTVAITPIWDILNYLREKNLFTGNNLKAFSRR